MWIETEARNDYVPVRAQKNMTATTQQYRDNKIWWM